ncbi:MAG: hypothetical protein JXA89_03915 [Anaerolineae bacterium]|nr:hypothetical protein [Anaerolineae bacterium]
MDKRLSAFVGLGLIIVGLMALASTVLMPMLGIRILHNGLLRLWPLTVSGVGWCFILPPLLVRNRRGLGGLFIPGIPILTTGAILTFASVFNWWSAWEWLWPLEVLSVAAGFIAAAAYMRVIWLCIPAFIIGANGLLFQFCAITGLWDVWAVMWTIEPLSIGLALLFIGARKKRPGLLLAGLILCTLSGVGLIGMMAIVSMSAMFAGWWLFRLAGPALLIFLGVLLLAGNAVRYSFIPKSKLR